MVITFLIELQKFQKNSRQNISKTVTNERDKEIPKERYVSPEEKQGIVDENDKKENDKKMTKERHISPEKKTKHYWCSKMNYNSIIMEYKKIINLLHNKPNEPTKSRTKTWLELNDDHVERITLIVKLDLKLQC